MSGQKFRTGGTAPLAPLLQKIRPATVIVRIGLTVQTVLAVISIGCFSKAKAA
jgi:hypothetical protein